MEDHSHEEGRPRETTARSREEAISRSGKLVKRLGRSAPTDPAAPAGRTPTASVNTHLMACVTGLVNAGLEEGHLLVRQDMLRETIAHRASAVSPLSRG